MPTVLVVGVDELTAHAITQALEPDYRIENFPTAELALRALEQRPAAAIFCEKRLLNFFYPALELSPQSAAVLLLEPGESGRLNLNGLDGRLVLIRKPLDPDYVRCWVEQHQSSLDLSDALKTLTDTVMEHKRRFKR